jgi:GT2 family glycosyltransferase
MTNANHQLNVITLVHGRREQLGNLIQGLERSTIKPDTLLVVYMNEPAQMLHSEHFFIQTTSVNGDRGLPLAKARNAIRTVGADDALWVFLDVDCIPSERLLERYRTVLQERPDALHLGDVRYLPKGAAAPGWTEQTLVAAGVQHPLSEMRPAPGEPMDHSLFWSLNYGCTRRTFDGIGGFDEAFEGYGAEDTDFAFRARDCAIPLLNCTALAFHQYHPTYRPPLNHFDAIFTNAELFRERWGSWPMDGWLQAFADQGLLEWTPDSLTVIRRPTQQEVDACFDQALKGY